jgi:uncharacterized protein (TIGR03118 family)
MFITKRVFGRQNAAGFVLQALLSLVAIALLCLPATAQFSTNGTLYTITNLDSDIPNAAANLDTDLVNPWGLAASSGSPWWVSDNGTGLSTLYDGAGVKQGLVVTIPAWNGPTGGVPDGIQFNPTSDFDLTPGNPAFFIFVTEDGTVSGWNPGVDPANAVIKVNNWPVAVYKGLTLGSASGANYLYLANFRGGTVDVFDASFNPHSFGSNAFVDNTLPTGYAPFNVANINGNIIVTYALQDDAKHDDVAGPGHGYVDVFDSQGNLIMRLPHLFVLNSPWAVVLAPSTGFGTLSGKLLVGNFGSGAIVGFDLAHNGAFQGEMLDSSGLPLRIGGLWGLGFGNGGKSGPVNSLYYTAGSFGENHGLFGTITVNNNNHVQQQGRKR